MCVSISFLHDYDSSMICRFLGRKLHEMVRTWFVFSSLLAHLFVARNSIGLPSANESQNRSLPILPRFSSCNLAVLNSCSCARRRLITKSIYLRLDRSFYPTTYVGFVQHTT